MAGHGLGGTIQRWRGAVNTDKRYDIADAISCWLRSRARRRRAVANPPVPKRGVVEADLGSWKFRRFQGPLLDVEVWIDGQQGRGATARATSRARPRSAARIEDKDLVNVTVTRYEKPDGVVRETVKLVRRLAQEKGYQVDEKQDRGRARAHDHRSGRGLGDVAVEEVRRQGRRAGPRPAVPSARWSRATAIAIRRSSRAARSRVRSRRAPRTSRRSGEPRGDLRSGRTRRPNLDQLRPEQGEDPGEEGRAAADRRSAGL